MPVLAPLLWPKIVYKSKRGITLDEHQRILAEEKNAERNLYYQLLCVFGGLDGHPPGSESCFAGLPIESVFSSLGPAFAERLMACKEDSFRLRVLRLLSENGTRDGLLLAKSMAICDSCPEVRLLAFYFVFAAGIKGWHHHFAREVRRQGGWSHELLVVGFHCPEISVHGFRRRVDRSFKHLTSLEKRLKLQNLCYRLDKTWGGECGKAEYEWCRTAYPIEVSKDNEPVTSYRHFCLRRAAKQFPDWVALKIIEEVSQIDPTSFGKLPLECLTQSQKNEIVRQHIAYYTSVSPSRHEGFRLFANLSPEIVARDVLALILKPEYSKDYEKLNWVIYPALRELDRNAILSVVSDPSFATPNPDHLEHLLNALSSTRPDENTIIRKDVLNAWRTHLHEWIDLLPPLSQTTAHIWPNVALLLSELGHVDDAALILAWLQGDHKRVACEQEVRQKAYEDYRTSGGTTALPSAVIPCSYQYIYHQALWGFTGESVAAQITKLIEMPNELGFAANWLANHLGAPSAEKFSQGRSFKDFELVSARRSRSTAFTASADSLIMALKSTIDHCICDENIRRNNGLDGAFLALARLEGGPSGAWVIERLEKYYGDQSCEGLFESMTLVGASFEGKRLLPFVQRTIHQVLHTQYQSNTDFTYQVVQSLTALLYSDAPELAGQLIDNEAAPIFKNGDFQTESLIRVSRWSASPWTDSWLKTFFSPKQPERLRSVAFHIAIDRAADRQSFDQLRELALLFIDLGNLETSEGDWTIPRRLGEILSAYPGHLATVIKDALEAKSVEEARRWLRLLGGFETDQAVLVAFQLAERFGEAQLNVVTCITPTHQDGASISFNGWGAPWRRTSWQFPAIFEHLVKMSQSSDTHLRLASEIALFWLDRERLTASY